MTQFNASDIQITLIDQGFSNEITKDEVIPKKFFDVNVYNRSSHSLKWITIDIATIFWDYSQHKEWVGSVYGTYYATVGNTKTWGHKHSHQFENIKAGASISSKGYWHSFGRNKTLHELQRMDSQLLVYQYYGELTNGEKFSKILHPDLSFNANGEHCKLNSNFHDEREKSKTRFKSGLGYLGGALAALLPLALVILVANINKGCEDRERFKKMQEKGAFGYPKPSDAPQKPAKKQSTRLPGNNKKPETQKQKQIFASYRNKLTRPAASLHSPTIRTAFRADNKQGLRLG